MEQNTTPDSKTNTFSERANNVFNALKGSGVFSEDHRNLFMEKVSTPENAEKAFNALKESGVFTEDHRNLFIGKLYPTPNGVPYADAPERSSMTDQFKVFGQAAEADKENRLKAAEHIEGLRKAHEEEKNTKQRLMTPEEVNEMARQPLSLRKSLDLFGQQEKRARQTEDMFRKREETQTTEDNRQDIDKNMAELDVLKKRLSEIENDLKGENKSGTQYNEEMRSILEGNIKRLTEDTRKRQSDYFDRKISELNDLYGAAHLKRGYNLINSTEERRKHLQGIAENMPDEVADDIVRNRNLITDALKNMQRAKRKASLDNDASAWSKFWSGMATGFDGGAGLTLGLSDLSEALHAKAALRRMQEGTGTTTDRILVNSLLDKMGAEELYEPGTAGQIGQGVYDSLEFMLDMAITGGVGGAAIKGVKTAGKAVAKAAGKSIAREASETAAKSATKQFAKQVGKDIAASVVGSLASPMMYNEAVRRQNENYLFGRDENGEVTVREAADPESLSESFAQAFLSNNISRIVERGVGPVIEKGVKALAKPLVKITPEWLRFGNNFLSNLGRNVKDWMSVQGFLPESAEEFVEELLTRSLVDQTAREKELGAGKWDDLFSPEWCKVTLGSVAVIQAAMGLPGFSASTANASGNASRMRKYMKSLPDNIRLDVRRISAMEDDNQRAQALSSLLKRSTDLQRRDIMGYLTARAANNLGVSFRRAEAQQQEAENYRQTLLAATMDGQNLYIASDKSGNLFAFKPTDNQDPWSIGFPLEGSVEDGSLKIGKPRQIDAGSLDMDSVQEYSMEDLLGALAQRQEQQNEAQDTAIGQQEQQAAMPDADAMKTYVAGHEFNYTDPKGNIKTVARGSRIVPIETVPSDADPNTVVQVAITKPGSATSAPGVMTLSEFQKTLEQGYMTAEERTDTDTAGDVQTDEEGNPLPEEETPIQQETHPEVESGTEPQEVVPPAQQPSAPEDNGTEKNSGNGIIGRSATEEEAADLIARMEANAEAAPEVELTPENWTAQFGENGEVETPIGKVKMGEGQYLKLAQQGRDGKLGMIKPTLENPDVIIEDKSQAKDGQETERPYSYVFVKAFTGENGERRYLFTSVTVQKDGREVSISSQEKEEKRIKRLMRDGRLAYIKEATLPLEAGSSIQGNQPAVQTGANLSMDKYTQSFEKNKDALLSNSSDRHLAEHTNGVPDLLPTQENNASFENKGTQVAEEKQIQLPKNPVQTQYEALLAENEGDEAEAVDTATQMVSNKQAELEQAKKGQTKGKTVEAIQAAKRAKREKVSSLEKEVQFWKDVAAYPERKRQAEENARKQQKRIEAQQRAEEARKKNPYRLRLTERDKALGRALSMEEYVLRNIATGANKFLWESDPATKMHGLKDEGGSIDNAMLYISNETGKYPEIVAEEMYQDIQDEYPEFVNITSSDIYDYIKSLGIGEETPTKMMERAENMHNQLSDAEARYNEEAREAYEEEQRNERAREEAAEDIAQTNVEYLSDEEYEALSRPEFVGEMFNGKGMPKNEEPVAETAGKAMSFDEASVILEDVETEWNERIMDYIYEHYPTQATVSAATKSEQGLREREAMKKDERLKQLRADAKAAIDKADRAALEAYRREEAAKMADNAHAVENAVHGELKAESAKFPKGVESVFRKVAGNVKRKEQSARAEVAFSGDDLFLRIGFPQYRSYREIVIRDARHHLATEVIGLLDEGVGADMDSVRQAVDAVQELYKKEGLPLFSHPASRPIFRNQRVSGVDVSPLATERQSKAIATQLKKLGLKGEVRIVDGVAELAKEARARLQSVFHGSPHDFEAFDFSKMGTGEGAQAYGWGGYVTDIEGIGRSYAESLAGRNYAIEINKLARHIDSKKDFINTRQRDIKEMGDYDRYAKRITKNRRDSEKEYKKAEKAGNKSDMDFYKNLMAISDSQLERENHKALIDSFWDDINNAQEDIDRSTAEIAELKEKLKEGVRHLYHVEIPTEKDGNYLRWDERVQDKTLNKIVASLENAGVNVDFMVSNDMKEAPTKAKILSWMNSSFPNNRSGQALYEAISAIFNNNNRAASEFLSSLGFVGISYPAQYQSGGRSDNKRNYVIFKESDMKITDHIRYEQEGNGEIAGATLPNGDVLLNRQAIRIDTPFHEFAHKLFTYAKENREASHLYDTILDYAMNAPQSVKDYVNEHYPELSEEAYLDEVFAWALSRQSAGGLVDFLNGRGIGSDTAAQTWYRRLWNLIKDLWEAVRPMFSNLLGKEYADLSVFDAYGQMSMEEQGKALYDLLMGGKALPDRLETRSEAVRNQQVGTSLSEEERDIEERAKADGTYLKAPNGKPTKLTPRQWVQVQTKAFKDWFGDWELATKAVNIVSAMAEHGFKNFAEARDWAKKNIVRTLSNEETGNKGEIRISNTAIDKFLSQSSVEKSENKDVHLSVLKVLPDVLRESIDAEQHPDYKKGEDGERRTENGVNPNVLIHRLYGAVRISDKMYRVKVTMKEDFTSKEPKVPHSYEATKIELLAGTLGDSDNSPSPSTNNSISVAKLLQGVKKSNSEEEILNASKVVDENGEPLVVYHGTRRTNPDGSSFTIFKEGRFSFFSDNMEVANQYGGMYNEKEEWKGKVYECYLDIHKPLIVDANNATWDRIKFQGKFMDTVDISRYAYENGYDGVIIQNIYEGDIKGNNYISMRPAQIKSSTDNVGTFDAGNPDIRYRFAGDMFGADGRPKRLATAKAEDSISAFAAKYGFNVADVKKYADSMRIGNLGGASYAFSIMRRKIRIDNADKSLGEFVKIFAPIKAELYDRFGNIDELREKHVQEEMDARSVMEAARKRAEEEAEAEKKRLEEFEVMSDEQLDEEYFKAIEKNDEARMRDLVNEAARRNGYVSLDEFKMAHHAPSYDEEGNDKSMVDVANNRGQIRESLNEQLRMNRTQSRDESAAAIREALTAIDRGENPTVTIYRAVPKSLKEGRVRNGDWVTLSKSYAEQHGNHALEGNYRIMEEVVPAGNLYWDGNDINEWGYDDRSDYRYKNTRNNRKLNDLITRDDAGNIIPLSRRFDPKKGDVRFRRDGFWNRMTSDEIFEALSELSDFGNGGATRLILDLEKHFGGTLESASSGARSALENGLVPFAGNQYEGTDNEYHHMAFIDENGERHIESVPFTTQESIKEVRSDVRFAGDIFNADSKQPESSPSTSQSAKRQVAEELSKRLGVPVVVEDRTTPKGRSRRFAVAKAWFVLPNARNPKGEIHINIDNHADVEDVERSILHEVVGHMGMRRMMGEAGYNALLDKVYESMDEGARTYFGEYARQEFDRKDGMKEEQYQAELRRVAADEYIAALAEVGTDPTTWQKVVALVREALRRIGFSLSLSDADIRALLYESRHNLESAAYYADREILRQRQEAFRAAAELSNRIEEDERADARMRRDLSGTEYDKRLGVVSLTPDGATKRQELHNLATLWGKRLLDSSLPLKNLTNNLKHTKGGKVTSDTDLWSLKTTIPSKVMHGIDRFKKTIGNPLSDTIRTIYRKTREQQKELGVPAKKKSGTYYIGMYLMAKHMPERNAWMLADRMLGKTIEDISQRIFNLTGGRGAMSEKDMNELRREVLTRFGNDYSNALSESSIQGITRQIHGIIEKRNQERLDKEKARAEKEGITLPEDNMQPLTVEDMGSVAEKAYAELNDRMGKLTDEDRDFSGSTDFVERFGMKPEEYVERFETMMRKNGLEGELDKMWDYINQATEFSLRERLESGLLSNEAYNNIMARGWKNYVPLRSWDERNEESADYFEIEYPERIDNNSTVFTNSTIKAKGRKSLADNPLPYIFRDAETAIRKGEDNRFFQAVARLRDKNANLTYIFGNADFLNGKEASTEKNSHLVPYYNNGTKTNVVFVNPQLAAAVRGDTESAFGKVWRSAALNWIPSVTRFMSAMLTSMNPAFATLNLMRDLGLATLSRFVESSDPFSGMMNAGLFLYEWFRNMPAAIQASAKPGSVHTGNGRNARMIRAWKENGGETGWHTLNDLRRTKDQLYKEITKSGVQKSLEDVAASIPAMFRFFTEVSENSVRLAAFADAKRRGLDDQAAAFYSKEVTTNFNRHSNLSSAVNPLFMFFNAATQGINRILQLMKENPGNFGIAAVGMMAAGFVSAITNAAGGGDDDDYLHRSFYVRSNNLVIGKWTIPLAHGFRMFYGLGAAYADYVMGNASEAEMFYNVLGIFGNELMPGPLNLTDLAAYNPVEDRINWISEEGIGGYMRNLVPSSILPVYEIYRNRNFMGGTISREAFPGTESKYTPRVARSKKNVNPYLEALNYKWAGLFGFDPELDSEIAWDDKENRPTRYPAVSASDLEHLISQYAGGTGEFVNDMVKLGTKIANGEDFSKADVPVLKKLYRTTDPENSIMRDYYIIKEYADVLQMKIDESTEQAKTDPKLSAKGRRKAVKRIKGLSVMQAKSQLRAFGAYQKKVEELQRLQRKGASEEVLKPKRLWLMKEANNIKEGMLLELEPEQGERYARIMDIKNGDLRGLAAFWKFIEDTYGGKAVNE